jgi:hypothetical protein
MMGQVRFARFGSGIRYIAFIYLFSSKSSVCVRHRQQMVGVGGSDSHTLKLPVQRNLAYRRPQKEAGTLFIGKGPYANKKAAKSQLRTWTSADLNAMAQNFVVTTLQSLSAVSALYLGWAQWRCVGPPKE